MKVISLDHLVLTVQDIAVTCRFYTQVLGMEEVNFGNGRKALRFGKQKINLHQFRHEFEPKAKHPTPGSADLCFIIESPLEEAIQHIKNLGIPVLAGPLSRSGAAGAITSVYLRDPDQNLIEIATYDILF